MSTPKNQTIKNFPSIARVDNAGNITGIVVENANVSNVLNLTGDNGIIAAKSNGTIVLKTTDSVTDYTWSFDSAGGMIIPGNLLIAPGLSPQGTIINQENAELQMVATNVAGSLSLGWADSVFANNAAFMSFNGSPGNVQVITGNLAANASVWTYDNTGNLAIPGSMIGPNRQAIWNYANGGLTVTANVDNDVSGISFSESSDTGVYANANVLITANASAANSTDFKNWTFAADGNLVLPGNSFSVRYANGSAVPLDNMQAGIANGTSTVNIPVINGNILATAGTETWTYGTDGSTTFPNNTLKTIAGANAVVPSTPGTAGAPLTISAGTGGIAATSLNAGNGGNLTIAAGDAGSDIGNPSWGAIGGTLVLRGGNSTRPYAGSNVEIRSGNSASIPGVISLHTGINEWVFGSTGNLYTPGDIVGPANANFTVFSNGGVHEFVFGDDGTFYAPDNAVFGGSSIAIGPGANSLVAGLANAVFVASSNASPYIQAVINNVSDNGSADWVAQGHYGDDNGGWTDMGFTSGGFGDANYSITGQGDGYLFVQSYLPGQSPGGKGGNLVLATGEHGTVKDIVFATGGFLAGNQFARIDHANNIFWLTRAGSGIKFADGTTQTTAAVNTLPGGATTQIQFNDAGNFAGDSGLTYNKTTDALTAVGNITGGNLVTAGMANITGNANVGNVNAGGQVIANGNVRGGNIYSQSGAFYSLSPTANFAPSSSTVQLGIGATVQQLGGDVTTTYANGNVEFYGNVYVGYMTSEIVPWFDGQYNLGRATNKWGNLYVSNLASFGDVANFKVQGGTSGQFLQTDGTGNLTWANAGVTPGSNTQLIFNDAGNLGADSGLTYNKTTDALTVAGNITAANLMGPLANGNSNVRIAAANGNVSISVAGAGDRVVFSIGSANFTGNVDSLGFARFSGNVTGANLVTTGNANVGNLNAPGQVIANGNVRGGNIYSQSGEFLSLAANASFAASSSVVKLGAGATIQQLGGDATTTYANGNVEFYGNVYTGYITSGLVPWFDGQNDLGNGANRWGNLYVSNVASFGNVGNVKIQGGTTGQILSTDGNGNLSWITSSGSPAGSNTQIQFNNGTNFAADANLTWDTGTKTFYAENTLSTGIKATGSANFNSVLGLLLPAAANLQFQNSGMANKTSLVVADSTSGTVIWGYSSTLTSSDNLSSFSVKNDDANLEINGNTVVSFSNIAANFTGNINAPRLDANSIVTGATAPASSASAGIAGQIIASGDYIYYHTGSQWLRIQGTTF